MGDGSGMGTRPYPHKLGFSFSISLSRFCKGNDLATAISVGVTTVVLRRVGETCLRDLRINQQKIRVKMDCIKALLQKWQLPLQMIKINIATP
ncbi:hypothetical protein CsSME_00022444 [Camellia sinensis var. sinensis]